MIEYHYIDGKGPIDDIFIMEEKKEQYKKYFDFLYDNNHKFSRRQQCAYAIVSQHFPPDIGVIYTFIEEKFPMCTSKYTDRTKWEGNIRYTLSLNYEFKVRKIEIGPQGRSMVLKSIWTLVPSKEHEAKVMENLHIIDFSY